MELYNQHFNEESISIRDKINKINDLISIHEEDLANPILDYVSKRDDLKLIGKNKITNKNRAPTISFTSKKISSEEVSSILVSNNIATRNDNFYAWRCLNYLGIDHDDGVVRLSLVHYNSIADSEKIIKILEKV